MTRKHFEAIAYAMRNTRPDRADKFKTWRDAVRGLARTLSISNARFDSRRFVDACNADKD